MKKHFLLLLFMLPLVSMAQNLPQCDSLVIDCCALGNDTITLNASNSTTVLFDYPGFILFDSNMDTIAKENVTYFGISAGPQPHLMVVMAPLILPFTGCLNLYYMFYDSLGCSFPITIADTSTGIRHLLYQTDVAVYPNPSNGNFILETNANSNQSVEIYNLVGDLIFQATLNSSRTPINLRVPSGVYFCELKDERNNILRMKIVVE